ncbi:MAG: transglycosylase SLT domain-containing protein [Planctomycetota bacterium]
MLGSRRLGHRAGIAGALLIVALGGLWFVRGRIAAGVRPMHADARIEALAREVRAAADEAGLDPYLLAGLVYSESSGRVDAVSSAEALGLCQLQLPTARDQARRMGLPEPTHDQLLEDPALNLRLGASYLAWIRERQEGSNERALMAYNTGPSRFARWLEEDGGYAAWRQRVDAEGPPGPNSVRTFARRVLDQAQRMREEGLLEPNGAGPQTRGTRDPGFGRGPVAD